MDSPSDSNGGRSEGDEETTISTQNFPSTPREPGKCNVFPEYKEVRDIYYMASLAG